MRKTCDKCKKKVAVIFDATINKDICKNCKTPFPNKSTPIELKVGDKVKRKEFGHDRYGWELPYGYILTIRKISKDKRCFWFEEVDYDGRIIFSQDKVGQYWESKNFELAN